MLLLLPFIWTAALVLLVIWPEAAPRRQAAGLAATGAAARALFILGAGPAGWPGVLPGSVPVTLGLDLAIMLVLMGILRRRRLDLRWALLHAANPAAAVMVIRGDAAAAAGVLCVAVLLLGLDLCHLKSRRRLADPATVYLSVFCGMQIGTTGFDPAALYWTLPLSVLQPGVWTGLLYLVAAVCFAVSPAAFVPSFVGKVILWAPLYVHLGIEISRMCRRIAGGFHKGRCRTVSVVIPALNEAERIERTIRAVWADSAVSEVIVSDGGSTDGTATLAEVLGARVIRHDRPIGCGGGRGGQIRAGVMAARGDVVAVVHADTQIGEPAFSRMLQVLERNPEVPGGAIGCRFDADGAGYRLIEWANAVRMAYAGIGFGDQVQFFRREPVVRLDLFPSLPLMEDVELSLRLNRFGRPVYLFGRARVSPRRWSEQGCGNAATVIRLFALYRVQRTWKRPDAVKMYRQYYGRKDQK